MQNISDMNCLYRTLIYRTKIVYAILISVRQMLASHSNVNFSIRNIVFKGALLELH